MLQLIFCLFIACSNYVVITIETSYRSLTNDNILSLTKLANVSDVANLMFFKLLP